MSLILTLDSAGTPIRWSTWEDAVTAHCKGLIAWSLGDETTYYGGKSRLSGDVSTVSVPSIIALKGNAKIKRIVPALTNKALFGRDLNLCGYCGNEFHPIKLTRDHILATSRGGKNAWGNVVTACKKCNNHKDDKTLEEAGMSLLYVPYVPCRNEALILKNRSVLADQMDYLRAHLPKHSRLLNG